MATLLSVVATDDLSAVRVSLAVRKFMEMISSTSICSFWRVRVELRIMVMVQPIMVMVPKIQMTRVVR